MANREQRDPGRKAEAVIHTDNDHWNGYALAFLCKAKEGGKFPDLDKAMGLYSDVLGVIQHYHDQPLKGDRDAESMLVEAGMDEDQRLEVYQAAYTYLNASEFDVDLAVGKALLKGRTKAKAVASWTVGAREGLQDLVRLELAALPSTLAGLEAKERVAALCKLLPFALPRLSNVESSESGNSGW